MSGKVLPVLSGAAALVSILAFFRKPKTPANLASGVNYEAVVRVSPRIEDETAIRMAASVGGSVIDISQKNSATLITYQFTNIAPKTVTPGETLFQLEGRKAVLVSIKEL